MTCVCHSVCSGADVWGGGGGWIASLPLFGRAKSNKNLKCEYGKITANPLD